MQIRIFPLLIMLLIFISCRKESDELTNTADPFDALLSLPGANFTEILPPQGFERAFYIKLSQPLDHNQPDGEKFKQQIFLSHKGFDKPVHLITAGYGVTTNYVAELSEMLDANQILVTHRYFPGARTFPLDWQYLNIFQAASDHHDIVEKFKPFYGGAWVNSGISKGGMATLFHRRFYPDDVDVSVAYVAPIPLAEEDQRFDHFLLEETGTAACREKIKAFQRLLLERRASLIPLINGYANDRNLTFSIGADVTFEYAVCEYPFAFWQLGSGDCAQIPSADASETVLMNHLVNIVPLAIYSDAGISYYEPLFYQAFTELGYYGFITEHIQDLLVAVPNPTNKFFAPKDVTLEYHPSAMQDVLQWLQTEGDSIIYIYGGQDPWTAGAVELYGQVNALKIVEPGANHSLRIAGLSNREIVIQTLEKWLGIPVQTPAQLNPFKQEYDPIQSLYFTNRPEVMRNVQIE